MASLNFQAQPITVVVEPAVKTGIGIDATPGGKLSAPTTKPFSGGPRVQVVNSVPANLKSAAAPNLGQRLASGALKVGTKIAGVGLGVVSNLATDLIFPEPVGLGSDMVGGKPIAKNENLKPVSAPAKTKPQAQTQPKARSSAVGTIFEGPYSSPPESATEPAPTPAPAPFKPKPVADPQPRGAIDFEANPGTGTIVLSPLNTKTKTLTTPSLLDEVQTGGVNLLTPIVDFLKKLDIDIQQIKVNLQEFQFDITPLLQEISKILAPIEEKITAIPETFFPEIIKPILEGMVELLTPIANLTATNIEVSAKNPRTTSEIVAEFVAPIFLLITLLGTALDGIGKAISGLTLKTGIQIPQGMGVAAQIPMGMAASAQIPMGMAASAQIPLTQTVLAELPQTITATANLSAIDTDIKNLQQTLQKGKDELDKCCKDIQDKLKKKKKEDDDRFPEFKNDGFIECDGATIPYSYAGEGLKGLHQQQNIILGISKMMLKKVCENEIEFPLIQGGGTYVCDDFSGNYSYSGIGLLGLQNQIDRVLEFNKKILNEVCDLEAPSFSFPDIFGGGTYVCDGSIASYQYSGIGLLGLQNQIGALTSINTKILAEVCVGDEEDDIQGEISFLDCEGNTQVLLYSGEGTLGLSSQINALTEITRLTYNKACETPICVPVQPGEEFAEFDVPRQLVITWGENYPKQTGSLWHTQIPNPREDLEWCRDFDGLQFIKGNLYGRWLWENSKIKSGMRCVDMAEAERILDLIGNLTTAQGKKRFTIGGGVKLDPAVRQIRCVRAAIAQLNAEGLAEVVQCFVPPRGGC